MTETNQDTQDTQPTPAQPQLAIVKLPFDSASGEGFQWHLQLGNALIAKGMQTYPDYITATQAASEVAQCILQSISVSYVALVRQVESVQRHAKEQFEAAKAREAAKAEAAPAPDEVGEGGSPADHGIDEEGLNDGA